MPWCPSLLDEWPTADAAAKLKRSPAGQLTKRRIHLLAPPRGASSRSPLYRPSATNLVPLFADNRQRRGLARNESFVIIGDSPNISLRKGRWIQISEFFAGGGRRRAATWPPPALTSALRRHRKPYMLVDLLNSSKVDNFYALGAVFVALSKIILRDSEPCCPSIDPSLFMHRMSTRLLGEKDAEAAALRILSGTRGAGETDADAVTMRLPIESSGSAGIVHCCSCAGTGARVLTMGEQNTERDKTEEEEEDGDDINVYLNTEREKNYKTIVWELMNKNYIEEQASEISADDTKIRKERKRRREGDIDRGAKPTKEKQKEQRLSSRINYDAFSQFYETDNNGITSEHGNEEESKEEFNREATEDYNEEEEEACGDDKSAEDQGYDDFRDLGEDRGEGNYNEFDEF
ncbi:uncharacterized protein A4U43_C08F25780 [Asparagus officinalis]|nr:uncharacterized protein A4U43_C08F25780 [Asparagus officinalis]